MMSISLAKEALKSKKQKEPEPTPENVEQCADGTGAGVAAFYVKLLREKRGEERFCVARDLQRYFDFSIVLTLCQRQISSTCLRENVVVLCRYLNGEFRDESSEFQKDFIEFVDCKSDGASKTVSLTS